MKQKHKKKPLEQRQIANERIVKLFDNADRQLELSKIENRQYHLSLAQRYVDIANKISTKFKVKLPQRLKRRVCKNCATLFIPGANCRVRLRNKMVVYYCESCKKFSKIPYIREIKQRRKTQQLSDDKISK